MAHKKLALYHITIIKPNAVKEPRYGPRWVCDDDDKKTPNSVLRETFETLG